MKKTLMGTTALVAAAVAVSGARADEMMAEPITLTIGGNSHWGVAIVDNEAMDNSDDIAISNDVELKFHGSTVLDSGIEVGVRIEIEGEESTDQGDETYAYLEGSFGTIRIGNDDAASYSMGTVAPYATYFYGINTPYWSGSFSSGGWHSTLAGADFGDSASLMYFSPVINGFQFGVSYAPEAGKEARSDTASMAEGHDIVAVGARYDGSFGDAGITLSFGYASKDVPPVPVGAEIVVNPDLVIDEDGERIGTLDDQEPPQFSVATLDDVFQSRPRLRRPAGPLPTRLRDWWFRCQVSPSVVRIGSRMMTWATMT